MWEEPGLVPRPSVSQHRVHGGYYDGQNTRNAKVVHKPLADVKFDAYDLTGKLDPQGGSPQSGSAAGGMVLVAGDNRLPDETYLKSFQRDIIVLVGPELVLPVAPVDQTKKKEEAKDPAKAEKADVAPAVKPGIVIKGRAAGNAVVPAPQVEK